MNKVLLSECCGSPPWFETGLCSSCKEHADFININKKMIDNLPECTICEEDHSKEKEITNG